MHWFQLEEKMFVNGVSFAFGGNENKHMVNYQNCVGLWILELCTV